MRGLGALTPNPLALMLCSSYNGDGAAALYELAAGYESRYLKAS
jgi:hypothetical protein